MNTKRNFFTILIASLFLGTLACSISLGGPDYPTDIIAPSGDEVVAMQTQVQQALLDGAQSGVVTFQITEAQLTSYMVQKLQQQTDPPFSDPQILLRNGQMQMYGKVTQGYFYANMLIVMNVGVDPATGLPSITIASADFGPIDAPEGVTNAISSIIAEAFTGSFGPVATGIRIENISIADGVMTLTGRIK